MGNDPCAPTLFREPLSPEFCLRDPTRAAVGVLAATAGEELAYEWDTWPHSDRRELEIACRRLKEVQDRTDEQTQRLDREIESAARRIEKLDCELEELDRELKERTQWAQRLDRELESAARRIEELDCELKERTQWAQRLDRELEEHAARIRCLDHRIRCLDQELKERTLAHGRDLDRLAWALAVDRRFHTPLDYSFRVVRRAVHGVRRMLPGVRR